MKKQDLINAADELNSLLFEKPEIKTNVGPAETKGQIYEALKLFQPGDTLSKKTVSTILECDFEFDEKWLKGVEESEELVSVLQTLGIWLNVEETEETEETEEGPEEAEVIEEEETLEKQVKTSPTLKDLKIVAKTNDEFKSIRGQLTKYNNMDPLVEDMLEILNPEEEVKPEAKPKEAPEKKKEQKLKKEQKPVEEKETDFSFSKGDKVKFELTKKQDPGNVGAEIEGEVIKIVIESRSKKAYVQISTEKGKFHKRPHLLEKR